MRKAALTITVVLGLLAVQASQGSTGPAVNRSGAVRQILSAERGVAPARLPSGRFVPTPSGGMTQTVLDVLGLRDAALAPPAATAPVIGTAGCTNVFTRAGFPNNVRVNRDCGFRFQSEQWVAVNPTDPNNVVVSQNDSKYAGNRTAVEYSLDGGRHFGDSELPVGRISLAAAPGGQFSFDAITDPAHTFDSRGNLYYSAVAFDAFADGFDALVVWKSNRCYKGAVLHTPGSGTCTPFSPSLSAFGGVVNDNFANPALGDDKNLMVADSSKTSPFRDNVYITWTIFDFSCGGGGTDYCESPIFFSGSSDGGATWSAATQISGTSPDCLFGDYYDPTLDPNSCNFDQGSYPIVGPDGTIYVAFNNCNTATLVCQQMVVKSADGGATWSAPVKVADDFSLQPYSVPGNEIDSCPLFRQCLPPNGYRMNDFPAMGIDNATGRLGVFWSDFRNGGPCATDGTYGVPALPCTNINNDVFVSISTDGGATWGATKQVSPSGAAAGAQWQAWGDVGENGKLYVGYYDRSYGACESSGCNDITLARSKTGNVWTYQRITTRSMPNLTCSNNPDECGFLGDYMSTVFAGGYVHLVWGDTRGRDLGFPEEDIYYAKVTP